MSADETITMTLEKGPHIRSRADALELSASITIEAEVTRILYALSIPEYMESWLQLPEAARVECHAEARTFDRFRIDPFSHDAKLPSIYGSCHLSKPNRITYLWERDSPGSRDRTMVEIHILGSSRRYVLKLKHRGLMDHCERDWYFDMWDKSLTKLRILMERVDNRKTVSETHENPTGPIGVMYNKKVPVLR